MKFVASVCAVLWLFFDALFWPGAEAHADELAQSRRLAHFERLKQHSYFRSMSVVDGVPRLVLGPAHGETDLVSLAVFCKVVFDYYAELEPRYTQLLVIDGATGARFGVVDARGFHRS